MPERFGTFLIDEIDFEARSSPMPGYDPNGAGAMQTSRLRMDLCRAMPGQYAGNIFSLKLIILTRDPEAGTLTIP